MKVYCQTVWGGLTNDKESFWSSLRELKAELNSKLVGLEIVTNQEIKCSKSKRENYRRCKAFTDLYIFSFWPSTHHVDLLLHEIMLLRSPPLLPLSPSITAPLLPLAPMLNCSRVIVSSGLSLPLSLGWLIWPLGTPADNYCHREIELLAFSADGAAGRWLVVESKTL